MHCTHCSGVLLLPLGCPPWASPGVSPWVPPGLACINAPLAELGLHRPGRLAYGLAGVHIGGEGAACARMGLKHTCELDRRGTAVVQIRMALHCFSEQAGLCFNMASNCQCCSHH